MADASQDFDKIKRNVAKMLSMSAPEADIDAYLQTEHLTPQEFQTVATGKAKLGDIRMTQKSQGQIARTLSAGQTMPTEGLERAGLLPFSKETATGDVAFDPDAGILGVLKRATMAPGDVMAGKLDPGSEEGVRRAAEAGLTMTPMSPAIRASQATVPGTLKSLRLGEPKVPTAQELKAAGSAGFDQARNLGVDYSADAVKSMGDDIARSIEQDGFVAELAPKTHSILSRLKEPPEGSVSSLDNLVTLRKTLQEAAGDIGNPTERAAASRAIAALDDFIAQSDPASVVAGPASSASALLQDARGNYAAAMRSERVTGADDAAERSAAAAGSGLNMDNRRRQLLNSILNKPKERRGYSKEELGLIEEVVRGKFGTNLARYVGNLLGGGGGLTTNLASLGSAALGLGAAGDPIGLLAGAIPPAIGTAARSIAGRSTERQISALDELLRKRSPLYQKNAQTPPVVQGMNPQIQDILNRALLLQQLGQEGGQ